MTSYPVLILGSSGSGKSTSIRDLPHDKTFLVNVMNKPLPFRGALKKYRAYHKSLNPNGNMIVTDDYDRINQCFDYINHSRKEIQYIIIDDSQYLIVNEFMRGNKQDLKGNEVYGLYNNIAVHFYDLIYSTKWLRDELFIFFLHHIEYNDQGFIVPKTIGKLLNEKIDLSGMFTIVLYAKREGEKNYFYTQNDGTNPTKSPEGMFESLKIDNNLKYVTEKVIEYYKGEGKQ